MPVAAQPDEFPIAAKLQKEAKNHILSGLLLSGWLRLLAARWRDIEWAVYWPRCAIQALRHGL